MNKKKKRSKGRNERGKADESRTKTKCEDESVEKQGGPAGSGRLLRRLERFLLCSPSSTSPFLWSSLYLRCLSLQFVAQPNCQQLLATLWYDGFPGWRRRHWAVKLVTCFIIGLLFPVFSLVRMTGWREYIHVLGGQKVGGRGEEWKIIIEVKTWKEWKEAKRLVFLKVNLLPGSHRLLLLGNVGLATTAKETNKKLISLIRGY